MKFRLLSTARLSLPLATALAAQLSAPSAKATSLYWDTNGTGVADSGAATGTWGTDAFWSTDSTGLNVGPVTLTAVTNSVDDLFFSAGTTGTGGTVTVNASQTARKLTFEEDAITLSGGTLITLAGGGGLTVNAGAGNAIISTALTANGNNIFNVSTGRTLTLDTGAFTRGTQATLNVQGSGTVTSTKTGLATGGIVNGIIGPWASFGTGASTQYATFSGNDIVGISGIASTVAAIGNTPTANYDIAAVGTLGAGANVNTLRYTGVAGTIVGALTTKGIMNAGGGLLTFSGAVSAGANNTEIVLNAANHNITLSGILTGAITKTGSRTVTMGNVAHNIAGTHYVNEGILITNSSAGDGLTGNVTINSGGTLRWASSGDWNNGSQYTINAGGTLDLQNFEDLINTINGAGTITGTSGRLMLQGGTSVFTGLISGATLRLILWRDAPATVTLSGLNTYGGTTTIERGTLNINSIGNVSGGASAIGNPSNTANGTIAMGQTTNTGALVYTGGAAETNRVINLAGTTGGATITQSGTGLLKFTSALTATGAGSKTLTLSGSTDGTGEFAAAIVNGSGTTALTKSGTGTWVLSGTNTYTGATLISGGTLQIGNGIGTTGSIATASAITNDATLRINRGGALDMANNISGTGNLVKDFATGDLILNGNNSYGGGTSVNAGRLFINTANSLPTTGNVTVANGATLAFNASGTYNQSISLADGAKLSVRPAGTTLGNVTLPTAGSVIFNHDDAATSAFSLGNNVALTGNLTVQVGGDGGNATVGAVTLGGNISGSGFGLSKTQVGTLTLSGANTYDGATLVSAGTLFVTGSLTSGATVSDAATLGGGGTVAAVSFGGESFFDIALAVGGNALDSTATISFSTAGFGIDNLRYNGAAVDWSTIADNTYTLISGTLDETNLGNFGSGNAFDIDGISGTRTAYFTNGSLQLVVIPEPGAALLAGLGVLTLFRRQR